MADIPLLPPEQESSLQDVLRLARTCEYDVEHTTHVTNLAVRLFEELLPIHHLGQKERSWLIFAALLHDIGWIEGWKDHHKGSLRIILTTSMLNFSNKERLIIGSVARYHRKSLPDSSHDHFSALSRPEQRTVMALAACLRLADGLDRSHKQLIKDLHCKITRKKIEVRCMVNAAALEELAGGEEKKDLMEMALARSVTLKMAGA